jgi:hypothetical protein
VNKIYEQTFELGSRESEIRIGDLLAPNLLTIQLNAQHIFFPIADSRSNMWKDPAADGFNESEPENAPTPRLKGIIRCLSLRSAGTDTEKAVKNASRRHLTSAVSNEIKMVTSRWNRHRTWKDPRLILPLRSKADGSAQPGKTKSPPTVPVMMSRTRIQTDLPHRPDLKTPISTTCSLQPIAL